MPAIRRHALAYLSALLIDHRCARACRPARRSHPVLRCPPSPGRGAARARKAREHPDFLRRRPGRRPIGEWRSATRCRRGPALERLLRGSDLEAHEQSPGVVVVRQRPPSAPKLRAAGLAARDLPSAASGALR